MFLNPFNRLKLLQETKQSSFFTGLEIKQSSFLQVYLF